ncbi:MAG: protein kinase [Crocinitomicaceae bacterium]|nr:protein kinase [Crocinitomicaceae bacterium]
MSKEEELAHTIEIFNRVSPDGWDLTSDSSLLGGGQSSVLFVHSPMNGNGVFRLTKDSRPIAKERFKREIKVLSDYKHKNIVEILEYSSEDSEECWYISRRGDNFKSYWDSIRKECGPEALLEKAVDIIKQLAEGLSSLHDKGIVHRDIKPANIVVTGETPILIDFGLVYLKDEERVTPKEQPANNRGFSADPMRYYIDEIVPWLDVFQLSQLLIWMICERPPKGWHSPLSWRWVKYPTMPKHSLEGLRALTAVCSEPDLSPENANELKNLLEELFIHGVIMVEKKDLNQIKKAIIEGKARKLINKSEALDSFRAAFSILKHYCPIKLFEKREIL